MGKKPHLLIIMDGFAMGEKDRFINAIECANTENLDRLFEEHPFSLLDASGLAVGLPEGQMGNSEVGHTNIGSGRVVYQDLTKISKSIKEDKMRENEVLVKALKKVKENGKSVHILGLLSDGGVHSHIDHIKGLIDVISEYRLSRVHLHAFLDGRDTGQREGIKYVEEINGYFRRNLPQWVISSICGRFYAMDRDNRWDRTEKAYNAIMRQAKVCFDDPCQYVEYCYHKGVTDEFMEPSMNQKANNRMQDGDLVIFANYRPDRARQLTRAFTEKGFDKFPTKDIDVDFITMTSYDESYSLPVLYHKEHIENTLGEYISNSGLKQLRISETEKYAHVTFFLNAGRDEPFKEEDRILIESPKVRTYDQSPKMKAEEITEVLKQKIDEDKYDLIVLNFANCDMVGHTGKFDKTIIAVATVDRCVNELVEKIKEKDGVTLITADHGNADKMIDENGEVITSHTTNKVPFCVVGADSIKLKDGKLCDIAPTLLELMGLEKPKEMTGESLIVK